MRDAVQSWSYQTSSVASHASARLNLSAFYEIGQKMARQRRGGVPAEALAHQPRGALVV